MKLKLLTVAAGIALLATSITAKAQKVYKEGVITYTVSGGRGAGDAKTYFRADSNVTVSQSGPAKISVISAGAADYLAILVDVPVANMKKAAIANPAEVEQIQAAIPELTFTPTTEAKQIAGLNCKKVMAKDPKSGTSFEVWITNDISAPTNGMSQLYSKVGGFPVQFTTYQMGQSVAVTFKAISDEKVPAGAFGIPAGFDKISMTDLQTLGGNK
ncbi:MAG: DUF4412 domain-containing protein [Bacteroidota bacterium]